jgi:hypothetical protein
MISEDRGFIRWGRGPPLFSQQEGRSDDLSKPQHIVVCRAVREAYGPYCVEWPGREIKSFAILDSLFEISALEALDMAVRTVFGSAKVQFLGAPGRKLRGLG